MSDEKAVMEAMYIALIEIRERAEEVGDEKIRLLANLFHNTPHQLLGVLSGERRAADVRKNLEEKADETGIRGWLDNVYRQRLP